MASSFTCILMSPKGLHTDKSIGQWSFLIYLISQKCLTKVSFPLSWNTSSFCFWDIILSSVSPCLLSCFFWVSLAIYFLLSRLLSCQVSQGSLNGLCLFYIYTTLGDLICKNFKYHLHMGENTFIILVWIFHLNSRFICQLTIKHLHLGV